MFETIINHFENARRFYLIIHVFSVVLGMGGALVLDNLFQHFMRDFKIDHAEKGVFKKISSLIWVALYAIVFSGIGIFLSDIPKYMNSPKFFVKMTVVFCVIINGYLIKIFLEPFLHKIDFADAGSVAKRIVRRRGFVLGAVSAISWVSAFVLAMLKNLPYTYFEILAAYGVLLLGTIIVAQIMERLIARQAYKKFNPN